MWRGDGGCCTTILNVGIVEISQVHAYLHSSCRLLWVYCIASYRSLFIAVDFIYWLSICSCIMYIYLGISSYLSFHLNMFSLHEHAKIVSQHLCYLRKFIGFVHCFDDDTALADAVSSQVSISCSQTALNVFNATSTKIHFIIFTCIFCIYDSNFLFCWLLGKKLAIAATIWQLFASLIGFECWCNNGIVWY